jgi:NADH:ubiquinone oxidoreductase subunit 6 (subunit J)
MVVNTILVIAAVIFAIESIRARRLIVSALWLAGTSALLSLIFYLLGAYLVAVIELSVGAGLVTVLFVFAISIAGEEGVELRSLVPKALGGVLALLAAILLGWLSLPAGASHPPAVEAGISEMIWQIRGLDVLVQMVLIFSGVLGLLGLLAEEKAPLEYPVAERFASQRERELEAMQEQTLEKELV